MSLGGLDHPVRLVVLPEGSLQGFTDEIHNLDHVTYARTCAISLPGAESEELGRWASEFGVHIMAQAKALTRPSPTGTSTSTS